jgi:hypothetical protein
MFYWINADQLKGENQHTVRSAKHMTEMQRERRTWQSGKSK